MELRPLEMTIISAKDIQNVKHITTMDVYVEARISCDPNAKHRTPVAKDGGMRPTWNFPIRFTVDTDPNSIQRSRPIIFFTLRCARHVRGDKDIGEVRVPVMDLLAMAGKGRSDPWNVSYPVLEPSGHPKGELSFSFQFGEGKFLGSPTPCGPPGFPYSPPATRPLAAHVPYEETPPLGYPPVGLDCKPQPPEQQPPAPQAASNNGELPPFVNGVTVPPAEIIAQFVGVAYEAGYQDGYEDAGSRH